MYGYYFYELKTLDSFGFPLYYYFVSAEAIRNVKTAKYPQKIRLLIEDHEEIIITIRPLNPFTYIWKKYFQKGRERVNWEKEEI